MAYLQLGLICALCVGLVWYLRLKAVFLLVLIAFTQNMILPFLYTEGLINVQLARGLVYSKEVLCLILSIYSLKVMYAARTPLRVSMILLFGFTIWCIFTGAAGLAGKDFAPGARWIREECSPMEFVTIGAALATRRLVPSGIKAYISTLAVISLIAMCLIGPWGERVWGRHINIAAYNVEVKNESVQEQDEEHGVNGSGNMSERSMFGKDVKFRAMGTFGEPLSMAFNMAFGLAMRIFVVRSGRRVTAPLLVLSLVFSFTRSAWIFFVVTTLFVFVKRQMIWKLTAFVMIISASILLVNPLSAFVKSSVYDFQGNIHPHSRGIKTFYSDIWSQRELILGNGAAAPIRESGYAALVIRNGLPAYCLFLAFCIAGYLDLGHCPDRRLRAVMQGVIIAVLVVMHFSFYPLSFSAFIVIWLIFGAAISGLSVSPGAEQKNGVALSCSCVALSAEGT